jgi:hypothetical protein
MDFRSRASSNFSPDIGSEIGSTDFVEVLVGLQAEAAGDDLLLDLGGAAETLPNLWWRQVRLDETSTTPGWRAPDVERDVFIRHAKSRTSCTRWLALAAWTRWLHGPNTSPRPSSRYLFPATGRHVQGVTARARGLAPVLGTDADPLEASAWLHDIGYAPGLVVTGLHTLDGTRYLRNAQHADTILCRQVAHYSCAIMEAEEHGLADVLARESEPAPQR